MGRNRKILVQCRTNTSVVRRSHRKKNYLNYTSSSTTITDLPNEILLHIFSLLPRQTVIFKIGAVCKRWNELTKYATFWWKVDLNGKMPVRVVNKLISKAPQLKHLVVEGRIDLDRILEKVSLNCEQLERLEVSNCRGSRKGWVVHSLPMCNIISRCSRLHDIHFHQTTFKSCKFFKLLPRNRPVNRNKPCSYVGPITSKQLNAFLESIRQSVMEKSVVLGNNEKMYKLEQLKELLDNSPEADQTDIGQAMLNAIWQV